LGVRIYTSKGERPRWKGREEMGKENGENDKGNERELRRGCRGVQKILKIDPDERLYLFKRMTQVRKHQAER